MRHICHKTRKESSNDVIENPESKWTVHERYLSHSHYFDFIITDRNTRWPYYLSSCRELVEWRFPITRNLNLGSVKTSKNPRPLWSIGMVVVNEYKQDEKGNTQEKCSVGSSQIFLRVPFRWELNRTPRVTSRIVRQSSYGLRREDDCLRS